MTKPVFDKEKISQIVEFMMSPYTSDVFYKFEELPDDKFTIKYFGLHPGDSKKLNELIQLKFGN